MVGDDERRTSRQSPRTTSAPHIGWYQYSLLYIQCMGAAFTIKYTTALVAKGHHKPNTHLAGFTLKSLSTYILQLLISSRRQCD